MKKMDHDKDGRASLSDFREMASALSAHGNYLSLKQNVTIICVTIVLPEPILLLWIKKNEDKQIS